MSEVDQEGLQPSSNRLNHPWHNFLGARAAAIDYLYSGEGGDPKCKGNDHYIAQVVSMIATQVMLIRTRDRSTDIPWGPAPDETIGNNPAVLREYLRVYGGHIPPCAGRPCECGFQKAWEVAGLPSAANRSPTARPLPEAGTLADRKAGPEPTVPASKERDLIEEARKLLGEAPIVAHAPEGARSCNACEWMHRLQAWHDQLESLLSARATAPQAWRTLEDAQRSSAFWKAETLAGNSEIRRLRTALERIGKGKARDGGVADPPAFALETLAADPYYVPQDVT